MDKFLPWIQNNNYHCYTLIEAVEDTLDNNYSDDTQDTDDSEVSMDSEDDDEKETYSLDSPQIKKNLEEVTKNFNDVTTEVLKNLEDSQHVE